MRHGMLHGCLVGLLALGSWAAPAAAQNTAPQAALSAQIEAKRMEIRHHTALIQGIQDPALLQSETLKHFLMVEEMLALVLEQQRQMLLAASAPATGAMRGMEGEHAMEMPSAATPSAAPPMGGMGGGMMDDDAMEMPSAPTQSAAPPTGGGMMDDDAMEMPSAPTPNAAPMGGMGAGGMMGGGHEMMGMGGMKGGAVSNPSTMTAAGAAAQRIAEREALLKEIDVHLAYLGTVSDPVVRTRETIKHQEMLDRLLAVMR